MTPMMIEALPVEAAGALSPQALMDHVGQPTGQMSALSAQFDRLMALDPNATLHNKPLQNDGATVATEFVSKGETMMRETFDSMNKLTLDAPYLNTEELAMRQMQMSMQIALANFQFNACAHVAQSGKTGMQTLIKNQ